MFEGPCLYKHDGWGGEAGGRASVYHSAGVLYPIRPAFTVCPTKARRDSGSQWGPRAGC